jgi:hypothetical protein
MESLTPVLLAGVLISDSRAKTGALHGHHFHITVTDLQTPVYSSAPVEIRTPVLALKGPCPDSLDEGGL